MTWSEEHDGIVRKLITPCFGRRKPRIKGTKTFLRLLLFQVAFLIRPDLTEDIKESLEDSEFDQERLKKDISAADLKKFQEIMLKGNDFYNNAKLRYKQSKNSLDEQKIRMELIQLCNSGLSIQSASLVLIESGLCPNLISNYTGLCNRLSLLGIPVEWNIQSEKNWRNLEDNLKRVINNHKITVSQAEAYLLLGEDEAAEGLSNREINTLVLEAKEKGPDGSASGRLWNMLKSDVRRGYGKYRRRLKEVGIDYDDYKAFAYNFFLKKIEKYNPERNVPFKAYFLKFLRPEMNRWVTRKIYSTGRGGERVQRQANIIKGLKGKKEIVVHNSFDDYLLALKEFKQKYYTKNTKVKMLNRKSINPTIPTSYIPLPKAEMKDIFLPDNIKRFSVLLKGRQKEVFERYYGRVKTTESIIADELNTTQQNVSKHLKKAIEKIFNFYLK